MRVALLPPITPPAQQTCGQPARLTPITELLRYARSRGQSRWHRIRSGYVLDGGARTFNLWCGQVTQDANRKAGGPLLVDERPAGDEACAVCVGKALGAGQDDLPEGMPALRYDPRWVSPPSVCPGSGATGLLVEVPNSRNVVRCLACGLLTSGRALGSPYNPSYGVVKHAPGVDLVPPCPFHAWNHLRVVDLRVFDGGRDGCGCEIGQADGS